MDVMGLPYTGVPTEGVFLTIGKLMAKERLRAAGLPTPGWIVDQGPYSIHPELGTSPRQWIVKAVYEHASFGMEDDAVLEVKDPRWVRRAVREQERRWGRPCFAEQYIEGREFNLSLLARPGGVDVLPPAEIDFSTFPAGKPHIVGYKAKWDAESFEFHHTPRRFDFPTTDAGLLDELSDLSRRCWRLFGLRGHVRVDFRIDESGQPWILEINPNPCLSPDAGFAAALERGGVPFVEAVRRILDDSGTNPYA
jgi:D-alanine-D-alanine ligase